jgi:predicted nucleic acid-binding protein
LKLVIDASAMVAVALHTDVRRLRAHDAHAPALMWSEALATLRRGRWFGQLGDHDLHRAVDGVLSAPVRRHWSEQMYRDALRLADGLGWARTYDAEYVALAQASNAALVTADARLRRRVGSIVEVVDPADVLA